MFVKRHQGKLIFPYEGMCKTRQNGGLVNLNQQKKTVCEKHVLPKIRKRFMPYKARKLTSVVGCYWQGKEDEGQEVNEEELMAATYVCRTDRK